jgi:hypothetical protein
MRLFLLSIALASCVFAQTTNELKVVPTPTHTKVGDVKLYDKQELHSIGLSAPDTVANDAMFRLPAADGSGGQAILTDGNKNLSFGNGGGPSQLTVSAANPLYVYFHFRDDNATLFADYSRDGMNFKPVSTEPIYTQSYIRDASTYYDATSGTFWTIASQIIPGQIPLISTQDLKNYTAPIEINVCASSGLSGCQTATSPEWFTDPNSGVTGFMVSLSDGCATICSAPYWVVYNPNTNTIGSVTAVSVTGTTSLANGVAQNIGDFFLRYDSSSSKYYLFYMNLTTAQRINYAVSSTLTGPYAQVTSSSVSVDHFGFGAPAPVAGSSNPTVNGLAEGPDVLPLPSSVSTALYGMTGCWRVYADTWLYLWPVSGTPNDVGKRQYTWKYVDTCPASAGTDPFAVVEPAASIVKAANSQSWSANTFFTMGQVVRDPSGHLQVCVQGGTSGASAPTWNDSGSVPSPPAQYQGLYVGGLTIDNQAHWKDYGPGYAVVTYVSGAQFGQFDGGGTNGNLVPLSGTVSIGGSNYTISNQIGPGQFTLTGYTANGACGGWSGYRNPSDSNATPEGCPQPALIPGMPTNVRIAEAEQGTIVVITDPNLANIVYRAEDDYRNRNISPGFHTVGTSDQGPFTLTVESKQSNGYLTYNDAPTLAIGGVDTSAIGSAKSYATWTACGNTLLSCPNPIGGTRTWVESYNSAAPGVQINNIYTDHGEAALSFSNGQYQFGLRTTDRIVDPTGSALGNKAYWKVGTNNQCFGPMFCSNIFNNWFYFYNAGLGPTGVANSQNIAEVAPTLTNPGFETGALSPWTVTNGASVVSTAAHNGSYSAKLPATGTVSYAVTGLTPNVTYQVNAWVWNDGNISTSGVHGTWITVGAAGSASPYSSGPYATNTWYQIGAQYQTDSSGTLTVTFTHCQNLNCASEADTTNTYVDDLQIYPEDSTPGAFPLGISPSTGEVRANYGVTLGAGDSSATNNTPYANIDYDSTHNALDIGDGTLGHRNRNLQIGTLLSLSNSSAASNAGVVVEASSQLIDIGVNEGSPNRFGTYNSTNQGGMLRIDSRSGQPVFAILGRNAGTTGDVSTLLETDLTSSMNRFVSHILFDGGTIRATGETDPCNGAGCGAGVSMLWNSGAATGHIASYDQTTSAYKPLNIDSSSLTVNSDLAVTGWTNASGYKVGGASGASGAITCNTAVVAGTTVCTSIVTNNFTNGIRTN